MTTVYVAEKPTPNPELTPGQIGIIQERVLAARNFLNDALDQAAHNGIPVEVRLIGVMNVGAARRGIPQHYQVEALPIKTAEEVEREERETLFQLKFKYEHPGGALFLSPKPHCEPEQPKKTPQELASMPYDDLYVEDYVSNGKLAQILNENGFCNKTVCPECGVDDFTHVEGCSKLELTDDI
jgi:hypothetical protein